MSLIEVRNLSKKFGENIVLEDISFKIEKGTFTALLGKNGSGKSTVLNILMGQLKLDKGECYLFGQDIKKDPYELKNKIGHVSEKINLDYPMKINDFIGEFANFYDVFDHEFVSKMAKDLKIDLSKNFADYSRGQKMQIVLMVALAHNPELLLIDEITSVLDASARNYFIPLLKDYVTKGGTVVITTNIVSEVQFYCTDVLFLSEKKLKFQSALADLPKEFTKILIPKDAVLNLDKKMMNVGINSDGSQSFIVPKNHPAVSKNQLDRRSVTLEDVYIYHGQGLDNE